MSQVSLKVKDTTHKRLLDEVSKLQLKHGKRVTIDEAISELLDNAERSDSQQGEQVLKGS